MSPRSVAWGLAPVVMTSLVVIASAIPASAQDIPGYPSNFDAYDPREMAMLPPFCMYTMLIRDKVPGGTDSAKTESWKNALGPAFINLHHYCWGLIKTNRGVLLARKAEARASYLNYANIEFDYVIERSPADFVLLPEILTKRAENLIRLNKGALALADLERAIELKPDYWPPYAHMSDFYKSVGDRTNARSALERGLSASPDTPALTRRLAELDSGKPSAKATP
jgi:tetratricopeptide (TPR) repeat protein